MDIKSMLSESAGQKTGPPRISTSNHTPHSSYDGRIDYTPSSDVSSARPTPYGQPSAGGVSGYFSHSQSPYPNASASSTPSIGQHSTWGQSPGGQSQGGMSIPPPPHNPSSFVSPHPPTPGSNTHSLQYYQQQYQQLQSPPFQPGHLPHGLSRQISPAQYQAQPATPLGPPIGYPKPSPHRPSSQGGPDHLRRASVSSISSIISNHNYAPPMESIRRESATRSHRSQDFGRERSTSISPKTIPRPPPQREMSTGSQTHSHGRPSIPSVESRPSLPPQHSQSDSHPSFERQVEPIPAQATPNQSISSQQQPSIDHTLHSSPAMERPVKIKEEVQSLKRSASHLSDVPVKIIKRVKHEKPIWAQSARRDRYLNLNFVAPAEIKRPQAQQQRAPPPRAQPQSNGTEYAAAAGRIPFATSISDVEPMPDMVRQITQWVCDTIGHVEPPGKAMFELEAKIGHIQDNGKRIYLPFLDSEVLLGEHGYRFRSEMTVAQHRHINEALNAWTEASNKAHQKDPRVTPITYQHPKENDEFFELTDEGRAALDPELLAYIESPSNMAQVERNGRRQIRVRRTQNPQGTINLIKTRIANREIHCPHNAFDYRLSISLEAGWYGSDEHLRRLNDTRGRNKDRVSYQHSALHVDLTQVRHDDSPQIEHELELELDNAVLEDEMYKYRHKQGCRVHEHIAALLSNTKVLVQLGGQRRS